MTEELSSFFEYLRTTFPHDDYCEQLPIQIPAENLFFDNATAKLLGDVLNEVCLQTHNIRRIRNVCLSLNGLTERFDEYASLLIFLENDHVSVGRLHLDGYGDFALAQEHDPVLANVATRFIQALIPPGGEARCMALEVMCIEACPGISASVMAHALTHINIHTVSWDTLDYVSENDVNSLAQAFRDATSLRVLHLEVSTDSSCVCIAQIVSLLHDSVENLTLEWPILDTPLPSTATLLASLELLLSRGTLHELHLRHLECKDDRYTFPHLGNLPSLVLGYCDFDALAAERLAQATCSVQKLTLRGTKLGLSNHVMYHTLAGVLRTSSSLHTLQLEVTRFPNLSASHLITAFNSSPSLQCLCIENAALSTLLPHIPEMTKLKTLRIVDDVHDRRHLQRALRQNRSLVNVSISGRTVFEPYSRRNRGLQVFPEEKLFPIALQQVFPCHDAPTWIVQALLRYDMKIE